MKKLLIILVLVCLLVVGCTDVKDTVSATNMSDSVVVIKVGSSGTKWRDDYQLSVDIISEIVKEVGIKDVRVERVDKQVVTTIILDEPGTVTLSISTFGVRVTELD